MDKKVGGNQQGEYGYRKRTPYYHNICQGMSYSSAVDRNKRGGGGVSSEEGEGGGNKKKGNLTSEEGGVEARVRC